MSVIWCKKEEAIEMIKNSNGKIFGVRFIKRTNGEMRTMSARRGVSKGVTGEGLKYDPESKQLLTVYDMNKQGHRMINTNDIMNVRISGDLYMIYSRVIKT